MHDQSGFTKFAHAKNVAVGNGRVMWAGATTDCSGKRHPEGWVLPGGERTQDEARARAAAALLSDLSTEAGC